MSGGPTARFLVMSADGEATTTVASNADREEALTVARELHARGQRVWVMRIDGGRIECGTREDDALRAVAFPSVSF